MKKLLLGLLIPVVVIAGLGGGCYYMVKDDSAPSYTPSSLSTASILKRTMVSSLDDTKEEGKIKLSLTQDDFNQMIYNAYSTTDRNVREYLKGVEIKIEGKDYHIRVYTGVSFVKTVVDLTCSFSSDEDNYYLTITKSQVGKIGFLHSLTFTVLEKALDENDLNAQFASSGIRLKADFANQRFIYSKDDAFSDLVNMLKKSTGENDMVSSLASFFCTREFLSFDAESKLSASIDLSSLQTNTDFVDDGNLIEKEKLNLDSNRDKVLSLLRDGKIDDESNHPKTVFTFLSSGYDALSEEERKYIDSADLSSVGFDSSLSKMSHLGYEMEDPDIRSYFEFTGSNLKNPEIMTKDGLLIEESKLNQYLQSQNLIGYSYLFTYTDEKDRTAVNYVSLDNAYFNFYQKDNREHMDMVLGINVSGYETTMVLENVKSESLPYGMKLLNENIYFGNHKADEGLKSFIYTLTKNNLPENEFLTFDGEGTFEINFEGYLRNYIQALDKLPLKMEFALDSKVEGTSIIDPKAGLRLNGSLKSR